MGPSLVEYIFPFSKLPYLISNPANLSHRQWAGFLKGCSCHNPVPNKNVLGRSTFTLLTPEYFPRCTKGPSSEVCFERDVTCNLHLYTVKWFHFKVNYELLKIRCAAQGTRSIAVFGCAALHAKDWEKRIPHEHSEIHRMTESCCSAREQRCFGVRTPSLTTPQHHPSQQ